VAGLARCLCVAALGPVLAYQAISGIERAFSHFQFGDAKNAQRYAQQ
jgi:hypothetical protein